MISQWTNDIYRGYRSRTFSEIFPEFTEFNDFYINCGIETTIRNTGTKNTLETLYYLLMSRYANSAIASSDENRFKFNVMSIIFQYGPTWERKLEIQKSLRTLTDTDLITGSKVVYNHANNPSVAPSTDSDNILSYIDDQNVTSMRKSKMDAYTQLYALLEDDITEKFISRFKILFSIFPAEHTIRYITEEGDED